MSLQTTDRSADQALRFLHGRIDYERAAITSYSGWELRLEHLRDLLARLGNPQDKLKIVHVAGTKGKGSTSAMIAAAMSASGHRTGLFTSPHLDRLEERIMIDGQPCSSADLTALVQQVRPIVEQMDAECSHQSPADAGPTYFEIITVMAFLHFAQAATDVAVVEVGMGGRFDSTNVCRPLVSVITSISFDHTQQLGNTLAAIAGEKAGIIKAGVPVVSGVTGDEPRRVIEQKAREFNCTLAQLGADFDFKYAPPHSGEHGKMDFDYRFAGRPQHLEHVELGLLGRHQAANAGVALAVLAELRSQGWQIPEADVRRGLAEVRFPARVDVVSRHPTIVIDAAHNVASIEALLETLDESFQEQRRLLIFGTTQEKDARGMLRLLLPRFDAVIFTRYLNNPRAVDAAELDSLAAEIAPIQRHVSLDPAAAWEMARQLASPDHLICVTGSFFLAAEMRREIARLPFSATSRSTPSPACSR